MDRKGTIWHPGTEVPPLHKKVWTDDDGSVHRMKMSDWMLVQDDTCDPEYTGPVVVARYVQDGSFSGWTTGSGNCGAVICWRKAPIPPEAPHA